MNSPPPPPIQNEGTPCPNCGSFRPANQTYCANCGYGMVHQQPSNTGLQVLWIVLFILIGLPAGCLGGCFLLVGLGSPSSTNDITFWMFVAAGLGVFILLLWLMIRSFRKKT